MCLSLKRCQNCNPRQSLGARSASPSSVGPLRSARDAAAESRGHERANINRCIQLGPDWRLLPLLSHSETIATGACRQIGFQSSRRMHVQLLPRHRIYSLVQAHTQGQARAIVQKTATDCAPTHDKAHRPQLQASIWPVLPTSQSQAVRSVRAALSWQGNRPPNSSQVLDLSTIRLFCCWS